MPLHVARLRDSDLAGEESAEACWYAVLLWAASWHQLPAGSLPDNDAILTRLIGLGKDLRTFRKHKTAAMRKFILCSDGRLYHPVVAEQVIESWNRKLQQRWRSECARIKKHNQRTGAELPMPTFDEFMAGRSVDPCPEYVPGDTTDCPPGQSVQETGTGTGTSKEHPQPPPGAFEDAFRAYPEIGRANTDEPAAREAWGDVEASVGAEPLLAAIKAYAASDAARRAPRFDRWLKRGLWAQWRPVIAVPGAWVGPFALRAAVEAAKGPAWAASWLLPCAWRDLPSPTLVAPREIVAHRLREVADLLAGAGVTVVTEKAA